MGATLRKMPEYECHKKVSALKIEKVEDRKKAGALLHFENKDFAPREVSERYVEKHGPVAGGYFVVYEDGYQSFSPAQAFEKGYTPVK